MVAQVKIKVPVKLNLNCLDALLPLLCVHRLRYLVRRLLLGPLLLLTVSECEVGPQEMIFGYSKLPKSSLAFSSTDFIREYSGRSWPNQRFLSRKTTLRSSCTHGMNGLQ